VKGTQKGHLKQGGIGHNREISRSSRVGEDEGLEKIAVSMFDLNGGKRNDKQK
jgi:hypothetical protein